MLCGYLPFENSDTSQLYKTILNAEYSIPEWVSKPAISILGKILTPDPKRRISLSNIKAHPWYQQVEFVQPSNIYTKINKTIWSTMEGLGFNQVYVINSVKDRKHNHLTATYYLLAKNIEMQNSKKEKMDDLLRLMNNGNIS